MSNDNGKHPANPVTDDYGIQWFGLTKREYFAGLAMQGMKPSFVDGWDKSIRAEVAKRAVAYADALLAELEKTA